jgi:hypothetical protein
MTDLFTESLFVTLLYTGAIILLVQEVYFFVILTNHCGSTLGLHNEPPYGIAF